MANSMKFSLMLAKIHRLCPPDHIREKPEHALQLKKHLARCPYCSTDLGLESRHWQDISHHLAKLSDIKTPGQEDDKILPGQIRPVKQQLAVWRNGFFYNPPLVMIRDVDPEILNLVQAVQIYEDIQLAAPGDLIVEEDTGKGLDSFFIECWNRYCLHADCLDKPVGMISSQLLDAVRKMETDPEALPEDALHPLPLLENDPRHYFRKLEISVGYTFAAPAAEKLMTEQEAEIEKNVSDNKTMDVSGFIQQVEALHPDISWPYPPQTVSEAMLTAQIPEDKLPMAADDGQGEIQVINHVVIRQHRLELFESLYAEIITKSDTGHGLSFSGKLLKKPPEDTTMSAAWMSSRGTVTLPKRLEFQPETGMFYIEIPIHEQSQGDLVMALVTDYDQDDQ
jgi:hypothetical protein